MVSKSIRPGRRTRKLLKFGQGQFLDGLVRNPESAPKCLSAQVPVTAARETLAFLEGPFVFESLVSYWHDFLPMFQGVSLTHFPHLLTYSRGVC